MVIAAVLVVAVVQGVPVDVVGAAACDVTTNGVEVVEAIEAVEAVETVDAVEIVVVKKINVSQDIIDCL